MDNANKTGVDWTRNQDELVKIVTHKPSIRRRVTTNNKRWRENLLKTYGIKPGKISIL